MRCLVCNCSELDDDALFDKAYASLSVVRKKKADKYKSRKDARQSVTAGLFIGLVERKFGDVTEDENGKPCAKGIEFNLSHSGNYVVFAYSESPVGVDIERIGRNIDIAKRVMTSEEYDQFVNDVREEDKEDAFCRMWTAKESYMKYRGLGFRIPPESFRVLYGYQIRNPENDFVITELGAPKGYCISVCSADDNCSLSYVSIEDLLGDSLELDK